MGGIFGVVSSENCIQTLFYGTDYHSHLGTESGGMAVLGPKGFHKTVHSIAQAQFKSRFVDDYKKMDGNSGIGAIDETPQPLVFHSKFGVYAVAASGLITNKEKLVNELLNEGASFGEMAGGGVSNAEIVASLINRGNNIVEGIASMRGVIEGSICALVLTTEGIYAARDKYGRFPLSIGINKTQKDKKSYVVATEASSFENLDYELIKFLGPGEIVLLTTDGVKLMKPEGSEKKICAFLWIYTGYPSSVYEGIRVEGARERCGIYLAKRDNVQADLVSGIPDSGVGHAIGYSMGSGIPYRRALVKYTPGYGRSYTPPTQEIRDLVAQMKLCAVREVIKGSRIIVCDDSIVRGTQLKNLTVKKLWDNGAKEIHIRPACPPLMFPCIFASSTRTTAELAGRKAIQALEGKDVENPEEYLDPQSTKYAQMIEWIRRDLNVTSLKYLAIEDMIAAIGLPAEQLCLYCWQGR
ncbi:amidophosphoribosyltransferase [hydrocarbon metagenome]|uniref:amidophosphoribosyltransferase n=1 Tax=hydrocarbon metagenome TaxID=938273 RepID=A0A0W8FUF5_9ZZZZ